MESVSQILSKLQVFCVIVVAILTPEADGKIYDLSHVHSSDLFYFPGSLPYNRTHVIARDIKPGMYVNAAVITSGEHVGTHMDAPAHFVRGGDPLEKVSVERTIADGVHINCRAEAAAHRDYMVPMQKILDWEKENGRIPDGAAVLFNFGWSLRFNNITDYAGSDQLDDQFTFVQPAVTAEVGQWLLRERKMKIIGVDTFSPDPSLLNGTAVTEMPNHHNILGAGSLIVENMKIPADLPARGFRFHATPVMFEGSGGTQVRAFAMTYDPKSCPDAASVLSPQHPLIMLAAYCCLSTLFLRLLSG
ncbi:isatin hydrolase [Aplysia californica]|uniref:Isatin hydrolase n=1 Tax=Aplysia californica TaxID=6500 RepID=A0ABM0JVC6_APLCA|nr:isatin hydrolase [Aplysia californica]